jgi:hypothetical protein
VYCVTACRFSHGDTPLQGERFLLGLRDFPREVDVTWSRPDADPTPAGPRHPFLARFINVAPNYIHSTRYGQRSATARLLTRTSHPSRATPGPISPTNMRTRAEPASKRTFFSAAPQKIKLSNVQRWFYEDGFFIGLNIEP